MCPLLISLWFILWLRSYSPPFCILCLSPAKPSLSLKTVLLSAFPVMVACVELLLSIPPPHSRMKSPVWISLYCLFILGVRSYSVTQTAHSSPSFHPAPPALGLQARAPAPACSYVGLWLAMMLFTRRVLKGAFICLLGH